MVEYSKARKYVDRWPHISDHIGSIVTIWEITVSHQ